MTSLNSIQTTIEPALTAMVVGMLGSLIFSFCQYFGERRHRREFRNSWSTNPAKDQAAPAVAATPWNWIAGLLSAKATRREPEPFPSFASYFVHRIGRHGFAVFSVTLVLIVRWLLEPVLEGSMPFSFFLAAVLFTARTQGIWETILALVLGFLLGTWFFAQPRSLGFSGQHDWWAAGLYFTIGFGIIWLLKSEQTAWLRSVTSDFSVLRSIRVLPNEQPQGTRELLANIVEWAHDPILSISPEGRIMTWNAAAELHFGWPAQEAIGQTLTDLLPPTLHAELDQVIETIGKSNKPKHWQINLHAKNGDRVEALMKISPIKGTSGHLVGLSLIAQS